MNLILSIFVTITKVYIYQYLLSCGGALLLINSAALSLIDCIALLFISVVTMLF